MKLIMKSWVSTAVFIFNLTAFGQDLDPIVYFTNSQPIAPSPTAASLGLYGSYPVSTATGLPTISIPLFDVGGIGTSIPVSLSYHGGGQKVTSVASWVGLGWSLNAGGTITRSVVGNEDGSATGIKAFYSGGYDPEDFDEQNDPSDFEQFRNIAVGGWTADPDIYSFNFMEFSGQFYIDLDDSIRLFSHQDLEFERVPFPPSVPAKGGVERFIVKTGDGRVLEFSAREETRADFSNSCSDPESFNKFQSAWHLTKITTPQDVFILEYESETIEYETNIEASETKTALVVGGCVPYEPCFSFSTLEIDVQQLTSIIGPYGTAVFTSGKNRTGKDLRGGTALETIEYLEQKVRLNTFFSSTNRLKLDNVAIIAGNQIKKWDLRYFDIDLPQPGSFSIDHWGYYNGAQNPHLMPAITTHFPVGANREPDTLVNRAGQLLQIDYPTGGSTVFNWEQHKRPTNETIVEITSTHASVFRDFVNSEDETSQTFTINFAQPITVDYFVGKNGGSNTSANTGTNTGSGVGTADEPGDIDIQINPGFSINVNGSGSFTTGILEPGTYTFKTLNNGIPFNTLEIGFDYENRTITDDPDFELMGGFRISSIDNFDQGELLSRKSYLYKRISAGNFIDNSRYLTLSTNCVETSNSGTGLPGSSGVECNSVRRTSSSNFAITNNVSYSHVIEFDGESFDENGRIEYFYNASSDDGGGVFNTPKTDQSWKRSLLEKKLVYDKDNQLLSRQTFDYDFVLLDRLEGLKAGYTRYCRPSSVDINSKADNEWSVRPYDQRSEWAKLVSMSDEMFTDNGTFTEVTTFDYFHPDDHVLPNKIVKSSSRGEQEVTIVLYPKDFVAPDLTIPVEMQTDFFRLPIEFVRFRGEQDRVMEGGINIYDARGLVIERYALNTAAPIEGDTFLYSNQSNNPSDRSHFRIPDAYELENSMVYTHGNGGNRIREVRTRGGTKTYLWGYNNSYIVAEFDQISFDDLAASGNISRLNSFPDTQNTEELRTKIAQLRTELPPNAFMKNYEYKQGIGISRVVDVNGLTISYEYDEFGRLTLVRDKDGDIIKHYSYEFK